jgi:hypothetical protein
VIDVWAVDMVGPIAAEFRAEVVDDDEEDVGGCVGDATAGAGGKERGEDECGFGHDLASYEL